ncbi:alpha/beta hydrolase, putative [Plasmodium gaboni]|uniref:Alpha/beta hydrolase, putative n=1 Tax=Plasmodium gaboni TaxID=647221 RepID=A0ABY1UIX0_9APIC|nr:alpha/beta hydrolase, putative [Plasmodium gaboni]
MGNALNQLIFRPHAPSYSKNRKNLHFIKTKHGSTICGIFINNNAELTILFSHGNAEDIGDIVPQFESKLKRLGLNMFAYDYSGYGQSTGYPTESHLYNDVEAAYNYLINELNVSKECVIAYGRSLGSAASVHIATKKDLLGLVLQCPLSSIHRVKLRLKFTLPYDLFCNIDKVHLIKCPILFIHGKKDKLLSYHGTEEMITKTKVNTYFMFIDEGGHNNLDSCFGNKMNAALITFLFVLKNNIRENVNSVYDISNINTQKLRNMFILNNTQKLKDKLKEKIGNKDDKKDIMSKIKKNDKVNFNNNVSKIKKDVNSYYYSSMEGICQSSENISNVKSCTESSYNSSTSVSTILASIESIMKGIPDSNTLCQKDSVPKNSNNKNNYKNNSGSDIYVDCNTGYNYYANNKYDNLYSSNKVTGSNTIKMDKKNKHTNSSTSSNDSISVNMKSVSSYALKNKDTQGISNKNNKANSNNKINSNSNSSCGSLNNITSNNNKGNGHANTNIATSNIKPNIRIVQTKRNSYKVDKVPRINFDNMKKNITTEQKDSNIVYNNSYELIKEGVYVKKKINNININNNNNISQENSSLIYNNLSNTPTQINQGINNTRYVSYEKAKLFSKEPSPVFINKKHVRKEMNNKLYNILHNNLTFYNFNDFLYTECKDKISINNDNIIMSQIKSEKQKDTTSNMQGGLIKVESFGSASSSSKEVYEHEEITKKEFMD